MNNTDLDFLFKEQKSNSITIIHNRSASGLTKDVKSKYEALYKTYINDSAFFDWNCSGCIIEYLTRLYMKAAEFAVNLGYTDTEATTEEVIAESVNPAEGTIEQVEEEIIDNRKVVTKKRK